MKKHEKREKREKREKSAKSEKSEKSEKNKKKFFFLTFFSKKSGQKTSFFHKNTKKIALRLRRTNSIGAP